MARLFDDAVPEYFTMTTAPVTTTPFTMACWGYDDDGGLNDRCMMQIQDDGSGADYFRLLVGDDSDPTSMPVSCWTSGGSDADFGNSTANTAVNTWFHACGVWPDADSRTAYINGGNGGTNNNTITNPTGLDSIAIGREGDSSPDDEWSGGIMWPAVWNVVLNIDEIAALGVGMPPWMIRPSALKFFSPLTHGTGNDRDWITGGVLTETGTIEVMEGPSILMPSTEIFTPDISIAIPPDNPKYYRQHLGYVG